MCFRREEMARKDKKLEGMLIKKFAEYRRAVILLDAVCPIRS